MHLTKSYSRPIWAGKGKNRHQKGTVLGLRLDNSLFLSWSLCDALDLRNDKGVICYNTEHGRSMAHGRFNEIYKGKHYTFDTANPPSYAELIFAGVPQSVVGVVVDLISKILLNQSSAEDKINSVSIFVKKPIRDLRLAYSVISSVAAKVNSNLAEMTEPIY